MPQGKLIRGRNGHTPVKAKKITPLYPTTADCQGLKAVPGAGFGRFTTRRCKILRLFRSPRSKQANTFMWWLFHPSSGMAQSAAILSVSSEEQRDDVADRLV